VVVIPFSEEQFSPALDAVSAIRQAGINAVFHGESGKLDKKLRFADRMGFAYVVLVGQREAENGEVSVKDMHTGETSAVKVADLAEFISE
jgi:histidyl-tRNA synthetase